MKQNFKKGFTLIELLVVIAIIGILAAITVVSVQGPRDKATNTKRLSELRQVAAVLEQYAGDNTYYNVSGAAIGDWAGLTAILAPTYGQAIPASDSANNYTAFIPDDGTQYCLQADLAGGTNQYIQCHEGATCAALSAPSSTSCSATNF